VASLKPHTTKSSSASQKSAVGSESKGTGTANAHRATGENMVSSANVRTFAAIERCKLNQQVAGSAAAQVDAWVDSVVFGAVSTASDNADTLQKRGARSCAGCGMSPEAMREEGKALVILARKKQGDIDEAPERELDPIKGHQARCRLYLLFSQARGAARQARTYLHCHLPELGFSAEDVDILLRQFLDPALARIVASATI